MAKDKDKNLPETYDGFITSIMDEAEKDLGENIMVTGKKACQENYKIIPWSPTLDTITSGIQEASWIGITGQPKTGKTTSALTFAAMAQKAEHDSRPVFYDNVEGRISLHHLQEIAGLDLDNFFIIQSQKGRILTTQERLNMLVKILRTVPRAVLIIDSISAYCDEKEMTEGVGTETRGGGAKLFGQFCRIANQIVPVNRSIVIGITHLICNTSGMGAMYTERAARMWLYQKDYDLRTLSKSPWVAGNSQIGLTIKWVCNTSKMGPPGMTMDGYLRFGVGIDRVYELASLAMAANLIKKSGSWMSLAYLDKEENRSILAGEDVPKFQGGEKLYQALLKRPDWIAVLEKEVMSLSSGLASCGGAS